jgi:hypothetical protein
MVMTPSGRPLDGAGHLRMPQPILFTMMRSTAQLVAANCHRE